ncbi:hypothetical protein ACFQH9_02215 [Pseudonocardia lutea]|uniref:Uncharacterized protein n=1 Tax=Pseudonocardia lutea TaxID=2172015 RepID=A0ABW1I0D4_9PSEU
MALVMRLAGVSKTEVAKFLVAQAGSKRLVEIIKAVRSASPTPPAELPAVATEPTTTESTSNSSAP